jgi:hypothetical protein
LFSVTGGGSTAESVEITLEIALIVARKTARGISFLIAEGSLTNVIAFFTRRELFLNTLLS